MKSLFLSLVSKTLSLYSSLTAMEGLMANSEAWAVADQGPGTRDREGSVQWIADSDQ